MDNKREFTRVAPHFDARIVTNDNTVSHVTTLDISMGGALVECDVELDEGAHCQLVIYLENDTAKNKITADSIITRNSDGKLALEFSSVDVDSYQHLEKLVLYNADQPGDVQEELDSHLGIRSAHKPGKQ